MPGERLDELRLPAMVSKNEDPKGTAFAVSVDLLGSDMSTGISAGDRARTLRALADPRSDAGMFARPGHLFPLRARPGGTLERGGDMERWDDLTRFSERHGLVMTTIADIQQYRRSV